MGSGRQFFFPLTPSTKAVGMRIPYLANCFPSSLHSLPSLPHSSSTCAHTSFLMFQTPLLRLWHNSLYFSPIATRSYCVPGTGPGQECAGENTSEQDMNPTLQASQLIGQSRPVYNLRVERSPTCLENQARAWGSGWLLWQAVKGF